MWLRRFLLAFHVRNLVRNCDQQAMDLGLYKGSLNHHYVEFVRVENLRIVVVGCSCEWEAICERGHRSESLAEVVKKSEMRVLFHQRMRAFGIRSIN